MGVSKIIYGIYLSLTETFLISICERCSGMDYLFGYFFKNGFLLAISCQNVVFNLQRGGAGSSYRGLPAHEVFWYFGILVFWYFSIFKYMNTTLSIFTYF